MNRLLLPWESISPEFSIDLKIMIRFILTTTDTVTTTSVNTTQGSVSATHDEEEVLYRT